MANNPLFNLLGGASSLPNMGGFGQMMQRFNEFKSTFQGDPRQKVQELLNSGQMTQAQYNQLQAVARMFMSAMQG